MQRDSCNLLDGLFLIQGIQNQVQQLRTCSNWRAGPENPMVANAGPVKMDIMTACAIDPGRYLAYVFPGCHF